MDFAFAKDGANENGKKLSVSAKEVVVPKTERDAFTLRLKPELFSFVRQAAEEENRSVPNFVETVLLGEQRRREAQNRSSADAK